MKMQVWSKWVETDAPFSSYTVAADDDITSGLEIEMATARTKMWGHIYPGRTEELTAGLVERRSDCVTDPYGWYPEAL